MGMLNSYNVYAPIEQNKEMKVVLTEVVERPNPTYGQKDKPNSDFIGYIDFVWQREDGRPMRDSRSFPQGVNILVEQLLAQHSELPTCVDLDAFTKYIIQNKTEFSCWSYSTMKDGIEYRNYGFREPQAEVEAVVSEPPVPKKKTRM